MSGLLCFLIIVVIIGFGCVIYELGKIREILEKKEKKEKK